MPNFETNTPTRLTAIELIQENAPDILKEQMVKHLRPGVALQAEMMKDDAIPVGASKFGGAADVPQNFEWPSWHDKLLGFFGQINLAEVASFDTENHLPSQGVLSFFGRFFDESQNNNGEEIKVLYFDSADLHRVALPDGIDPLDCEMIPPQRISFAAEWTTRGFYHTEIEGIWDFDEYIDSFLPRFGRTKNRNRVLGWPSLVQDFVFIEAEEKRSGVSYVGNEAAMELAQQNWLLLLQLDFKGPSYNYGVAYFVIHEEDLSIRNWDGVQFFYHGN